MGQSVSNSRYTTRIKRDQAIPVTLDGKTFYIEVNRLDGEMNVTVTAPPATVIDHPIAVASVPLTSSDLAQDT